MSSNVESVINWRKNLKKRALLLFDNKCVCCGYNKCSAALEFHHLDPEHKDFSIASVYSNPKSWDTIVQELKKCALVCSNCHREIHYGTRNIENKVYINLEYVDYKLYESGNYHKCICNKVITKKYKYCSAICASKDKQLIDWESEIENIAKLKDLDKLSFVAISKIYNTSDNTIRKWYYKYKNNI